MADRSEAFDPVRMRGSPLGVLDGRISPSGRVTIPAKWRRERDLAAGVVVSKGFDMCLEVRSAESWNAFERSLPPDPAGRGRVVTRLLLGSATAIRPDARGRFAVSEWLRDYACLRSAIVWVVCDDAIRLWDAGTWRALCERSDGGEVRAR